MLSQRGKQQPPPPPSEAITQQPTDTPAPTPGLANSQKHTIWKALNAAWNTDNPTQAKQAILAQYHITEEQIKAIQQEGLAGNWPTSTKTPTPIRIQITPDTGSDNKNQMMVGANNAIIEYIVNTSGYSRKHIKIGSWMVTADEAITTYPDHSFKYRNTIQYQNAFGADMESVFVASFDYLGGYEVKLRSIQFQK